MSKLLSQEIDGKLGLVKILLDKWKQDATDPWLRITELLDWERLREYHEAAVHGEIGGAIRSLAGLVQLCSYADLMTVTAGQLPKHMLAETARHLEAIRNCSLYGTPHLLLFDARQAQVLMLQGETERARALIRAVKSKMRFMTNSPIDMAVVLILKGSFEHGAGQFAQADDSFGAALYLLRPLRRRYQPTVEPLYVLANLWRAQEHRQLGNKWRTAYYAASAKRLHWRNRRWVIDWGEDLTQPVPYLQPFAD